LQLDRHSIEKRDFPITRKGYDTAAVDAHLRALAGAVEELQSALGQRDGSLAASAASQVEGILQAAQATAADIERQAREQARALREQTTAQASSHLQAVSQATAALAGQVQSMDGEVGSLLERLRGAGKRLAADLAALEGGGGAANDAAPVPASPPQPIELTAAEPAAHEPPASVGHEPVQVEMEPEPAEEDLDGARLVALNMALNGESRQDTERYLSQHFGLSESAQLLDEVYAAIEG
jgi:hypothetical protein